MRINEDKPIKNLADIEGGKTNIQSHIDRLQDAISKVNPKPKDDPNALLAEIDNTIRMMKGGSPLIEIDGKTYTKDLTWEPRQVQQPTPILAGPVSNGEILQAAGFIQEMLEAKHLGTADKPNACILEAAVMRGEDKKTLRPRGTRIFRVYKSRIYQNYQLTAFKTAVPEGKARLYELEITLKMGNEPKQEE